MPYELEQENINILKKFPTHRGNEKMLLLIHRHRLIGDIFPTQTDIRYTSSHRYHADAFITFVTDANQNSTQSTKTNASHKHEGVESKLVTQTRRDKFGTHS